MEYIDDTATKRSEHLFLTAYLAAIVAALLTATTTPQLFGPSNETGPSSEYVSLAAVGQAGEPEAAAGFGASESLAAAELDTSEVAGGDDGRDRLSAAQAPSRPADDAEAAALGLAPIDFDLGTTTAAGSSSVRAEGNRIEITKPLYSNGVELGSLAVTIDQNARLFTQRADLQALLQADEAATRRISRIENEGLVSFQRLREYGVSLRYDPIADRIVLQPG